MRHHELRLNVAVGCFVCDHLYQALLCKLLLPQLLFQSRYFLFIEKLDVGQIYLSSWRLSTNALYLLLDVA